MRFKVLFSVLLVSLLFVNFSVPVKAAIMLGEGSINLKAGDKKAIDGIMCIFSENVKDATYTIAFTKNLEKFVEKIEPNGFTLPTVECDGSGAEKRACVAQLCNNPDSNSTRMPTVYFSGPFGLSFDFCKKRTKLWHLEGEITHPCFGIHSPKPQKYQGGIRNIGKVGEATIVEPIDFIIHFYPYNGWIIVEVVVIVLVSILIIFLVYRSRRKLEPKITIVPKQT